MLFYPSQNSTWLIEVDESHQESVEHQDEFKFVLSQILYSFQQQKDPSDADRSEINNFCMNCHKELIYQNDSLMFIFEGMEEPEEEKQEEQQEPAKENGRTTEQVQKA